MGKERCSGNGGSARTEIASANAGSLGDLGQVVSPLRARFAASPARSGVGEGTENSRAGAPQVRGGCERPGRSGSWRATGMNGMPGMLGPAAVR